MPSDPKHKSVTQAAAAPDDLEWLLDLDLQEPEDQLFKFAARHEGISLTKEEAEMANRPLTRGRTGLDDLSNYVGEEIDFSGGADDDDMLVEELSDEDQADDLMAIDHSNRGKGTGVMPEVDVADGEDILELAEDDDISNYRLKRRAKPAKTVAPSVDPAPADSASDGVDEEETAIFTSMPGEVAEALSETEFETPYAFQDVDKLLPPIAEDQMSDLDLSLDLPPPTQSFGSVSDLDQVDESPAIGELDAREDVITQDIALDEVSLSETDNELTLEPLQSDSDDTGTIESSDELAATSTHETIESITDTDIPATIDPIADMDVTTDDDIVVDLESDLSALDDLAASLGDEDASLDQAEVAITIDPDADDSTFDQFLTDTDLPVSAASELEDEAIASLADDAVAAAELEETLDYPEAFQAIADTQGTSLVPESHAIEALKDALVAHAYRNAPANAQPGIDVRIGNDEQTRAESEQQAFVALSSLNIDLGEAQTAFSAQALEATFVRCRDTQNDDAVHNQWLHEAPAISDAEMADNADVVSDPESVDSNLESDTQDHAPAPAATLLTDVSATQDDAESIFEDDLFDVDVSDELDASEQLLDDDIDELLDSLSNESEEDGVICGVQIHEFDDVDVTDSIDDEAPVIEEPVAAELPTVHGKWYLPDGITFSRAGGEEHEVFAEFLDAFMEEGSNELEAVEHQFGEWEKDITDDHCFAQIERNLHTLKGIAKGVGLQRYGTLVHNFETLLENLERPAQDASAPFFRIVNVWLDAIVGGFAHISETRTDIADDVPNLPNSDAPLVESAGENTPQVNDSEQLAAESTQAAAATASVHKLSEEREKRRDKQLADEGAKALASQQSVRITAEKLDELLNLANQAQQLGVRAAQTLQRSRRGAMELQSTLVSVRTHATKISNNAARTTGDWNKHHPALDELEMDQYTELQEATNILREGVEDLTDLINLTNRQQAQVEALLKQQATVMSSINASVQGARVVPLSRMMPGLRRIVRTVSNELGKATTFKVRNEAGALDRDRFSSCQTIMEHMVRNALDHGIEMPSDRLDAGKANTGVISIDVRKEGADYIISLEDDGRGIDPEKMRDAVYEKGLNIDVDELTDEQAIRMIFEKGFSTASKVSEISGRGVGMDVVMSEVQKMGGDINITSDVGKGTRFDIRIPSNVTVNGALIVSAGSHSYAVPLDGLVAVEHVPAAEFFTAIEQGRPLQIYDMACEPSYLAMLCEQKSMPSRNVWGHTIPIVVAGTEKRYLAIAVDDVHEAAEVAVRSLGAQFSGVAGLAGGATTADGAAIIALDLNTLVANLPDQDGYDNAPEQNQRPLVLVVDDSRTQRMVSTSHFDSVGVETVTAENGVVAIDLLNSTHKLPAAILLDVEMPVKDGIQTLREIRQSPRYGHLPVIMVTSRTGEKHRALAEEAGCNGYMGKPFNFPLLIEQINALTGLTLVLPD